MTSVRNTATSSRARQGGFSSLGANVPDPLGPPVDDTPSGEGEEEPEDDNLAPDDPDRPPHIPLDRWIEFQGLSYAMSSAMRQNQPRRRHKNVKPRDPDLFDGTDPTLLDEFLFQCNLVFKHSTEEFESDSSKVVYAIQWLKGTAQNHFRNTFDLSGDERPEFYEDWQAFVSELRTNFGELDSSGSAAAQLLTLKMSEHHKAFRYKVEFEALAKRTDWGNASLRDLFYSGLAERIKDTIANSPEGKAKTLVSLKTQALTIDNRYWERKTEVSRTSKPNKSNTNAASSNSHSSSAAQSSTNSQRPSQATGSTSNRQSNPQSPSNPSPNSARQKSSNNSNRNASGTSSNSQSSSSRPKSKPNLDGKIDQDGRLTDAEKQRRKDNGLCLYCAEKGHLLADCPVRQAKEEAKARRAAVPSGSQPKQPPAAAPAKN